MTDNVNTIGQIFTNYQAALHLFEEAIAGGRRRGGPARARQGGPARGRARRLRAGARRRGRDRRRGRRPRRRRHRRRPTCTRPRSRASPARARRPSRCEPARRRAAPDRRHADAAAEGADRVRRRAPATARSAAATRYRKRLTGANMDLNELEETSHSAGGIFKTIMDRYKEAAKGRARVRIVIDKDWRVVRAHITGPRSNKLAGQLLQDHSGWFDLNDLHLARHVTWEPAELAVCEALIDDRGDAAALRPQRQGRRVLRRVPGEAPRRAAPHPRPHRRLTPGDPPGRRARGLVLRAARGRRPRGRRPRGPWRRRSSTRACAASTPTASRASPTTSSGCGPACSTRRPRPSVLRRDGAVALVDGDQGPGQVAGVLATDLSARARTGARRRRRRRAAQRALRRGRLLHPARPPRPA